MKISVHFISIYPFKKPFFSPVCCGPLSRWPPFEHSTAKMGSLDIDPVYSTLCPSITSTRSTSIFCINTSQCSVGGAVMLDAVLTARTVQEDNSIVALELRFKSGPQITHTQYSSTMFSTESHQQDEVHVQHLPCLRQFLFLKLPPLRRNAQFTRSEGPKTSARMYDVPGTYTCCPPCPQLPPQCYMRCQRSQHTWW